MENLLTLQEAVDKHGKDFITKITNYAHVKPRSQTTTGVMRDLAVKHKLCTRSTKHINIYLRRQTAIIRSEAYGETGNRMIISLVILVSNGNGKRLLEFKYASDTNIAEQLEAVIENRT